MGRNRPTREEVRGEEREWSPCGVHGQITTAAGLCWFYAGLGSKKHLTLWVPDSKAGSLCSHGECPTLSTYSELPLMRSLCCLGVRGERTLTALLAPSFCATHAFHVTSKVEPAAAGDAPTSGQRRQCPKQTSAWSGARRLSLPWILPIFQFLFLSFSSIL